MEAELKGKKLSPGTMKDALGKKLLSCKSHQLLSLQLLPCKSLQIPDFAGGKSTLELNKYLEPKDATKSTSAFH